jgi:CRP-like cAMP-binding protein
VRKLWPLNDGILLRPAYPSLVTARSLCDDGFYVVDFASDRMLRADMTGNLFLDTLPAATAERLLPNVTLEGVKRAQILSEPGVEAEYVYFPVRSLISTITRMADGSAVEVGIAGHEGMSTLSLAFGSRVSPHCTLVQIADSAYCMRARYFADEIRSDSALRARVLSYAQYVFVAATQFAACNRLHPMEQRYARWLLMADDRVGDDEFSLTQEYSAQMLGVRRAGVTVVAGEMSTAGLIAYRRGHVTVLDREGLEASSCECYRAVNDELQRLMGYGFHRRAPRLAPPEHEASPR